MIIPITSNQNDKNIILKSLTQEIKSLREQLSKISLNYKLEIAFREKKIYVQEKDIVMVEAKSNYSCINMIDGKSILTSKTLKFWQKKIQSNFLHRIHASYIVNLNFISEIQFSQRIVLLENKLIAKASKENIRELPKIINEYIHI